MGVAVALLRAGQVLEDAELIQTATDVAARHASVHQDDSPDLFHGMAGRLLAELLLWDETGDGRSLERAVRYGDALLDRCEGGPGEAYWRIGPGCADLSGKCYLGYAHGAAGIADVLLDLADATGRSDYLGAAHRAIAWISRQATSVLDDRSGLGWPSTEGGNPHPLWCHGATGIGRLFLHAHRLGIWPGSAEILRRTCRSVAWGARWSGPTLCHGLAGNAEVLLDAGTALADEQMLADLTD